MHVDASFYCQLSRLPICAARWWLLKEGELCRTELQSPSEVPWSHGLCGIHRHSVCTDNNFEIYVRISCDSPPHAPLPPQVPGVPPSPSPPSPAPTTWMIRLGAWLSEPATPARAAICAATFGFCTLAASLVIRRRRLARRRVQQSSFELEAELQLAVLTDAVQALPLSTCGGQCWASAPRVSACDDPAFRAGVLC